MKTIDREKVIEYEKQRMGVVTKLEKRGEKRKKYKTKVGRKKHEREKNGIIQGIYTTSSH
jgi:hypothetical protein